MLLLHSAFGGAGLAQPVVAVHQEVDGALPGGAEIEVTAYNHSHLHVILDFAEADHLSHQAIDIEFHVFSLAAGAAEGLAAELGGGSSDGRGLVHQVGSEGVQGALGLIAAGAGRLGGQSRQEGHFGDLEGILGLGLGPGLDLNLGRNEGLVGLGGLVPLPDLLPGVDFLGQEGDLALDGADVALGAEDGLDPEIFEGGDLVLAAAVLGPVARLHDDGLGGTLGDDGLGRDVLTGRAIVDAVEVVQGLDLVGVQVGEVLEEVGEVGHGGGTERLGLLAGDLEREGLRAHAGAGDPAVARALVAVEAGVLAHDLPVVVEAALAGALETVLDLDGSVEASGLRALGAGDLGLVRGQVEVGRAAGPGVVTGVGAAGRVLLAALVGHFEVGQGHLVLRVSRMNQ